MLPLEQRTLHGHFSRDLAPVLTIAPGDSDRFRIPNSSWYLESGEQFVARYPTIDTGHALAGPIAVRGARAGQTLVVRGDEVRPGSRGVTYTKSTGCSISCSVGTGFPATTRWRSHRSWSIFA